MKHLTAELTGALLDAAVARALGHEGVTRDSMGHLVHAYPSEEAGNRWSPSEDWAIGGPLIEAHELDVVYNGPGDWRAGVNLESWKVEAGMGMHGPTPLVAAMRALVSTKLGDEVELP